MRNTALFVDDKTCFGMRTKIILANMVRVYRYRLNPTQAQKWAMRALLELLRGLYNGALEERKTAYEKRGLTIGCYVQMAELKDVREACPEYAGVHVHLLQDAIRRVDLAFQAFFRRCKSGGKPGYPRFKGRGRYRTLHFKDAIHGNGSGLCAGEKRLRIAGVGKVKIRMHRPTEGRLKTISVSLDGDGHWYAALCCDQVPERPLPRTGKSVGVDLGLKSFLATSDGQIVANPRPLATGRIRVERSQRRVSRRRKGSSRRRKAVVLLRRAHARIVNVRRDFHHKTALDLVRRYDKIVVEDLNVKGLAGGMLAKSVNDAAWGAFLLILSAKAESAGREIVKVDPRGTSQTCSACGREERKSLAVRIHACPCGYVEDRDINAARNIEGLGRGPRGGAANALL